MQVGGLAFNPGIIFYSGIHAMQMAHRLITQKASLSAIDKNHNKLGGGKIKNMLFKDSVRATYITKSSMFPE